jgi:uncharacterized cupin superfamily protein
MPKIDLSKVEIHSGSAYPAPFRERCAGRHKQRLGDAAGLTQFGVNLARIDPGAQSALRHWHEEEDEFIYVLEGELVLIDDAGETLLRAGEAAAFPRGDGNGHHLANRSGKPSLYLEVGTRSRHEHAHYPDDDLVVIRDEKGRRALHKSGEPWS